MSGARPRIALRRLVIRGLGAAPDSDAVARALHEALAREARNPAPGPASARLPAGSGLAEAMTAAARILRREGDG